MKLRDKANRYKKLGFGIKGIKFLDQNMYYGREVETDNLITALLDTFDYDADVKLHLSWKEDGFTRTYDEDTLLSIEELERMKEEGEI